MTTNQLGLPIFTDWGQKKLNDARAEYADVELSQMRPTDRPDTHNATWIDVREVAGNEYWEGEHFYSNKRHYWKRLNLYNDGVINFKYTHGPYLTWLYNGDLIDIISAHFDMSSRQRRTAQAMHLALDRQKFGMDLTKICIGVCIFVVDRDENTVRKVHPASKDRDELFQQVEQSLLPPHGGSTDELDSIYGKVAYALQKWPKVADKYVHPDLADGDPARQYGRYSEGQGDSLLAVDDTVADVEYLAS